MSLNKFDILTNDRLLEVLTVQEYEELSYEEQVDRLDNLRKPKLEIDTEPPF